MEASEEHTHCVSCIQGFACRQQDACAVIYCANGCGVFTHGCKMEDHMKEVCQRARISCPNKLYGCPKMLTRRNLSAHLAVCPAYTISCPYGSQPAHRPFDEEMQSKCREVMRRDTFADHMTNHSNIHEGIDGWLESHCPLAFLGCPFTFRRWRPQAPGNRLQFKPEFDAFVTTWDHDQQETTETADSSVCHLLRMPPELLLRISSHLDGLSLGSLALTCVTMRKICAMLLKSKGCVTRSWVPRAGGKWELDDQNRWWLNRNMESIRQWIIDDSGLSALHDHLKHCPFNTRNVKSDPVMVIKAK